LSVTDLRLHFPGDSRMAAMMRSHDWSRSPLGRPEGWPAALRSVVGLMLESRVAMFVAWGPELGFLYNDPYADILGTKHPRALGSRFEDIWSEIWTDIRPLIDAALSGQSIYREDLPLVMNRQGSDEQTWFTFSYSPARDADGTVAGMFCAVWETTQKFNAERALRRSETRLRALTEASSNVIYRMNADWSRMVELQGQGFVPDAQQGDASWMGTYIHPDDRAQMQAAVQRAIDTRSMFELEHRVLRVDGTPGWTLSRAVPILDADGAISEWFGAASDVTERRQAQEALREANRTLERRVADALAERKVLADIVEATDAIVQVIDLEGRWIAFNRAAQQALDAVYGIRPRIGHSLFDALAHLPAQQAAVRALWQRAFDGEEFVETGEFGDPARATRSYEIKFGTLRGRDGLPGGAYQFVHDVTERLREQERLRHAEDSLRHAQKLESLGQLTGGVAHDFNNLLQVIASGIGLVEARGGAPGGVASLQRTLDAMRRAVKRGTDLTRHLLAFARRQPLHPAPVDLGRQLLGMREMLARSLSGDLRVEMALASDLWAVEVDAGELELAVLNLCVNARDAMPGGGTVAIGVENAPGVGAAGRPAGDFVRLWVGDTGKGMAAEVQARAFEPFFTTKETGKGSGLGLAQVYGFATQAGGEVRIDSTLGHGTTVTLLLPRSHAAVADAPAPEPAAPAAPAEMTGRVLFVEDDAEVAALTTEMLRGLGLEVLHVSNAASALGALADGRPVDIVFSDVMMPGGASGMDLARELQRRRPGLPIVLTTGLAASAAEARTHGITLLLKPYRAQDLAATLAAELGRGT
jgi:PAS domain S-box-containing protein